MNITHTHTYGYITDNKVFLKGYLHYPDREIGVVKETPELAFAYFEKRYQDAFDKVKGLSEMIDEAENKGSFLMKLLHMREYLLEFKGLGNFATLLKQLDESESYLRGLIQINRQRNLDLKKQIIQDLVAIVEDTNWKETAPILEEIKNRWVKTGALDPELEATIEEQFSQLIKTYYHNRKEFFRIKTEDLKNKLYDYKVLVDKAHLLRLSNDFEEASAAFKQMQADWKLIGKVPQKKLEKYWERFKKTNNEFFFRYKQYKEGVSLDLIKPLDASEQARAVQDKLCKQAEALVGINTDAATNEAKELLVVWKNEVTNPKYLDRNLANRFRHACDRIFEEGYLMRVVTRKYPDFYDKPLIDQFRIKTSFLRELVRKDEQEIYIAENDVDYKPEHKSFNLSTQKRKVQVKQLILEEFDGELKRLYQTKNNH